MLDHPEAAEIDYDPATMDEAGREVRGRSCRRRRRGFKAADADPATRTVGEAPTHPFAAST